MRTHESQDECEGTRAPRHAPSPGTCAFHTEAGPELACGDQGFVAQGPRHTSAAPADHQPLHHHLPASTTESVGLRRGVLVHREGKVRSLASPPQVDFTTLSAETLWTLDSGFPENSRETLRKLGSELSKQFEISPYL